MAPEADARSCRPGAARGSASASAASQPPQIPLIETAASKRVGSTAARTSSPPGGRRRACGRGRCRSGRPRRRCRPRPRPSASARRTTRPDPQAMSRSRMSGRTPSAGRTWRAHVEASSARTGTTSRGAQCPHASPACRQSCSLPSTRFVAGCSCAPWSHPAAAGGVLRSVWGSAERTGLRRPSPVLQASRVGPHRGGRTAVRDHAGTESRPPGGAQTMTSTDSPDRRQRCEHRGACSAPARR